MIPNVDRDRLLTTSVLSIVFIVMGIYFLLVYFYLGDIFRLYKISEYSLVNREYWLIFGLIALAMSVLLFYRHRKGAVTLCLGFLLFAIASLLDYYSTKQPDRLAEKLDENYKTIAVASREAYPVPKKYTKSLPRRWDSGHFMVDKKILMKAEFMENTKMMVEVFSKTLGDAAANGDSIFKNPEYFPQTIDPESLIEE